MSIASSRITLLACTCLSLFALSACDTTSAKDKIRYNGQYWQRVDTTDMIYQRGPKAQQMLMRDISRCTTELRELERMGLLRNALPRDSVMTDTTRPPADPSVDQKRIQAENDLDTWETPDRDGYLLAEPSNYEDFEGCMSEKGWERTRTINYETEIRARDNYLDAIEEQEYRRKTAERARIKRDRSVAHQHVNQQGSMNE